MEKYTINNKGNFILFLEKYKSELENPLIKGFLSIPSNFEIFKTAVQIPSIENKDIVEREFKKHCQNIKKIKYIDSLIRNYAIDYDKKIRKNKNRFLLEIDVYSNSRSLDGDILYEPISQEHFQGDKNLKNYITNSKLLLALESLTIKQFNILELIYIKNQSLKEIARRLSSTPQNISKIHRKAIENLKKQLVNEGEYEGDE